MPIALGVAPCGVTPVSPIERVDRRALSTLIIETTQQKKLANLALAAKPWRKEIVREAV
jgi:hypothetical protein